MFRSRPHQIEDLSEALAPRVSAARDAALDALDTLAPKLASARNAVAPPLASARDRLAPHVETALDTTRQVALDRVLPAAEVARERLAPVVSRATDAILDAVLPAVTAAAEAYEKSETVEEIRRRGEAAVTTLRTEGPEFARRRWPVIFGLVSSGAAAGALIGAVTRKRTKEPDWTSPAVAPVPASSAVPVAGTMGDLGPVTGEPAPAKEAGLAEVVDLTDADLAAEDLADTEPADTNPAEDDTDPDGVALDIDPVEAEAARSEQ